MREELKCVFMGNGELSVMMDGTQPVHMLHVNLWVYQEVRLWLYAILLLHNLIISC